MSEIDQNADAEKKIEDKKNLKDFLISLLTDMESLKNFIYQGQDIPAYRNLQKLSDRIKDKIREV